MKSKRPFWLGYGAGALITVAIARAKEDLCGLDGYIEHVRATWIDGWKSWLFTCALFAIAFVCFIVGVPGPTRE